MDTRIDITNLSMIILFMLMYFSTIKREMIKNKIHLYIAWILFCVSICFSVLLGIYGLSMSHFKNYARFIIKYVDYFGIISFILNWVSTAFLYLAFRKKEK